jgi:hypothetical protein
VPGRFAAIFLTILGLAQMAGDLTGWTLLRGLANATTASPAPKVFSAVDGLETYSSRFSIEWRDLEGIEHVVELTPEIYSRLRGPYNRRNAYGAVLAYGPILSRNPTTRPLFESVAKYAMCGDAPLLRELGLDPNTFAAPPRVRLRPLEGADVGDLPLVIEAPCR